MSIINYHRVKTKQRLLRGEYVHWIENNSRASYIRQCVLSFPLWVCHKQLRQIEIEAQRISKETGIPHVMDHIVPLNHPIVSGLTVPWNLQIITAAQNSSKGATFNPFQLDMFEE